MNETLRVINSRRSIRAYKAEPVADSDLQQIMDAALLAPNAINLQPWHFTVVQNQDLLDRMVKDIAEILKNSGNKMLAERVSDPNYHTFYHAPVVVFVSGEEKSPYIYYDCSAAAQNILLAAESLNIGSCWINSSLPLFASEKGAAYLKELGIPAGYKPVCSLALGYKAAENPAAPARKKDVVNYVK